ncbi:hypothetical protein QWZ00_15760 [Belliella kenyensis]|nr:hypothetical protein [Belliella kenyensis]MDN3604571.1 hypothetical protein [Belliella kenyensis]
MFTELNASGYEYNDIFYNAEFEDILSKIITCYNLMLADNVSLTNDENAIRDVLVNDYINNHLIKRRIDFRYIINPEVPLALTTGRPDIKIQHPDPFLEREAYYIIECKRLDATNPNGTTGLNAKYIENGMCRFASSFYSSHYKTNGMIGFVVEELDINENVSSINKLISTNFSKANTTQDLQYRIIVKDFEFSYCSCHNVDENNVILYHLMFDFSENIIK